METRLVLFAVGLAWSIPGATIFVMRKFGILISNDTLTVGGVLIAAGVTLIAAGLLTLGRTSK